MSHIYTKGISKLFVMLITALIAIIALSYFLIAKEQLFGETANGTPIETVPPNFTTIPSAGVTVSLAATTTASSTLEIASTTPY